MLNIFPLINIFTFFEVEVDKNESEKPTISVKLDQLLGIGTESPKDGCNDNVYEYFVELLCLTPL